MEPEEKEISVLEPITPAWDRVGAMLFRPFGAYKWLLIGFLAWLTQLSIAGHWAYKRAFRDLPQPTWEDIQQIAQNFNQWIAETLPTIHQRIADALENSLQVVVTVLLGGVILSLLCAWIRSRAEFLFINGVARNETRIAAPWRDYNRQGNSLFLFRLALTLISALTWAPLLGVFFYQLYKISTEGAADSNRALIALVCVVAGGCLGLAFSIVNKLTHDFVTPIMYRRRLRCLAGWRQFGALFANRPGAFVLYLLFQILLQGALGAVALLAIPLTCGLSLIPIVGKFISSLIVLPLRVFDRAYSMCFLAQFGRDCDPFAETEMPAAGSESPASPPPPQ